MREGSVVGKPKFPVGTSVATTNVNDRLITAGNCVFSTMGSPYGQAEGGGHLPAGIGVISGTSPEKGRSYVNQIFVGYAGGGARHGFDGWLTYCGPANGGLIALDSVEVDESMYPILIERRGVLPETQGYGEYEGAPGVGGVFYPLGHDMTLVYAADGTTIPPKGVLGGLDAKPSVSRKLQQDGEAVVLPAFHEEIFHDGEKVGFAASGGGGYGHPQQRDPERVAQTANRGWIKPETALEVYGVALNYDDESGSYRVDTVETSRLRASTGVR
jgi:N-methylhydantoinase B